MEGAIRYWLDGAVRTVRGADPTMTVLEHLRGSLGRKGTKEGCAEGDCGACTVVIGERDPVDGHIAWRAVNSCIQFLPMLDRKALVTIESLSRDGRPHPVQTAMVESHASQCGYCTPGIVMSLYARAIGAPGSTGPIGEALAGNLCRCTGYGPIIAAAAATFPEDAPDVGEALADLRDEASLSLTHDDRLAGVTRRWFAPRSVEELASLALTHPEAVFIAGATDVGLWVTKQRRALETLISLAEVPELRRLDETPEGLTIGAGVTYETALPALDRLASDLGAMVRRVGSVQVRGAGTIGGNLANGSPIGDMAPALIALGAQLRLRRGAETRELALEDFFLAYGQQDRRPGEFVESVFAPRPGAGAIVKIHKLTKRFDQDISAVCAAFVLSVEAGTVTRARIAFGGLAATPKRAPHCETALIGRPWTAGIVEMAAAALGDDFQPISDMRASAAYRLLAARNLLRKVFIETTTPGAATRVLVDSADDV